MRLTIKTKIICDQLTLESLLATKQAFTGSFNRICTLIWPQEKVDKVAVHHQTYYQEKEISRLPTALLITARDKAVEAVKACKTRIHKHQKTSWPQSKGTSVRYTTRGVTVKFAQATATIVTMDGRKKIDLVVSDYHRKFVEYKICMVDLVVYPDKAYLHIVVEIPTIEVQPTDQIVGVDLGVNRPAVTSQCQFLGGRRWKNVENRYFRLRRGLQSKGTRSAKRHLKKLGHRVNRFRNDCDHVLSSKIIKAVEPGATIVLEDLTDIRSRVKARKEQRRRIHAWSFARLKGYLIYKAMLKGVVVAFVDPRYTSQKCSKCGHIDKKNRKATSWFKCVECGFEHNADLNAAKNIRSNYIDSKGISVGIRLPSINLSRSESCVASPGPSARGN